MATTIKLKNSVTAAGSPTALAQGEVGINVTDKKVWVGNAATTPVQLLGAGATASFTSITTSSDASISGLTVGKGASSVATNTATGFQALTANTSGAYNTGVGYTALQANTSGSFNTGVGREALLRNTTGSSNTAFGVDAIALNTTGSYNTAVGDSALINNTTASNNTAVGFQAGYAITTGTNNSAFGKDSGNTITTGTYNTMLGNNAQASAATNNYELVISASTGITGKGSSTGYIYPQGGGVFQGDNSATWSIVSDIRLKKNVVSNNNGLGIINQIQVRNFEYRLPEEITDLPQNQAVKKVGLQIGAIAQELQAICPDCVTELSTGVLSVNTDEIFWHMVNAIKQLKAEIDQLKGN
jgi:hypothetical protein